MNKSPELDSVIAAAKKIREEREAAEVALATCRRTSRDLSLRLLIEFKLSVNRVSVITGHMRPTILTWIEAEMAKGEQSLFWPFPED